MECIDDKKELRKRVRAAVAALSEEQRREQSRSVVEQLERTEEFRRATRIAAFWPLSDEVDIREAVTRWTADKRVYLPVVDGDDMTFVEYRPDAELRQGELGIECPAAGEVVSPKELDLVIVPGVAFDRAGNRMGRGKGFYDRYLKGTTAAKIGICLAPQLVDAVPCQPHDVRMDVVISPEGQ